MSEFDKKYNRLTRALRETIKDYSLVGIRKLDVSDEETILDLLAEADMCLNVKKFSLIFFIKNIKLLLQYGENLEPDEKVYQQAEENMERGYQGTDFDEGDNDDN